MVIGDHLGARLKNVVYTGVSSNSDPSHVREAYRRPDL